MAWSASSDWERWDPDQYVICPYNISHRILASRFQRHLIKCRANYPDKDFVSCPFNASHQILRPHLRNHICSCLDKTVVEPAFNDYDKGEQSYYLKGDTSVPSYYSTNLEDKPDEDWDKEIMEDEPEAPSSINVVKNIIPFQYKSIMSQTREEFKRDMKKKALADEVNQRWCRKTTLSDNSQSSGEGGQDVDIRVGYDCKYNTEYEGCQGVKKTQLFASETGYSYGHMNPEQNALQWQFSKACRQEDGVEWSLRPQLLPGRGRARLIQDVYEKNLGRTHTNKICR